MRVINQTTTGQMTRYTLTGGLTPIKDI